MSEDPKITLDRKFYLKICARSIEESIESSQKRYKDNDIKGKIENRC